MNNYSKIALMAAEEIKLGLSPQEAWDKSSCKVFEKGSSSQTKGCPKNAFLGLYGINTNSKNAQYAIKALKYLRNNSSPISPKDLWNIVINGENKSHNSQMNVVLSLFENVYIK